MRLRPDMIPQTLAFIDQTWRAFAPIAVAMQRSFLDDNFDKLYQSMSARARCSASLSCIAIFIACLGLFGLAAFTAEPPHQGDRHPQGVRRAHPRHRLPAAVAVLDSRAGRQPDRLAGGLVLSARLAGGLRLSHHAQPALFPGRGRRRAGDRLGHGVRPCRAWRAPIPSTPCATNEVSP